MKSLNQSELKLALAQRFSKVVVQDQPDGSLLLSPASTLIHYYDNVVADQGEVFACLLVPRASVYATYPIAGVHVYLLNFLEVRGWQVSKSGQNVILNKF